MWFVMPIAGALIPVHMSDALDRSVISSITAEHIVGVSVIDRPFLAPLSFKAVRKNE
jgi:hypothetical protein